MDPTSLIHSFCFFYRDGDLTAGWVEGLQKNKLVIVPLKGKTVLLLPHRVALFWKSSPLENEKSSAHQKLEAQLALAESASQNQDLSVIHELIGPDQNYTIEDLIADFLDDPNDPIEQMGLFMALEKERRLFKRKKNTYTARTPEELEALDARQQREEIQQKWQAQVEQWLSDIESGTWNAETPANEQQLEWVRQIQSMLVYEKDSAYWKSLSPIFKLNAPLTEDDDLKIRRLLANVGHSISWSRAGLKTSLGSF